MTNARVFTRSRARVFWLLAVGLLLGLFATGGGSAAPPPTSCPAPSHPVSGLVASIDTSAGCNNPNGIARYPKTGWVAYNPGAGVGVQLVDGLEGLSTHKFYWGTYVFCLYPTYGSVSQTCSTYTVTQDTGSYPSTPPTITGTVPTITGGADGSFVAQYTLQVQNAPTGHLNSVKDDFWVIKNGSPVAHTATQSVKPPTLTPLFNVWLGYADVEHGGGGGFPSPWNGSPGVIFVGCGPQLTDAGPALPDACPQDANGGDRYDAGAIRIDNNSGAPLVVTGASVTIGSCTYTPWPGLNRTIAPGGTLILTQTGLSGDPCGNAIVGNFNFDTSESNPGCTANATIPVINLTINGTATTILDSGQILNTGGVDTGCTGTEFQNWVQVS
jgi:hypothetical protein